MIRSSTFHRAAVAAVLCFAVAITMAASSAALRSDVAAANIRVTSKVALPNEKCWAFEGIVPSGDGGVWTTCKRRARGTSVLRLDAKGRIKSETRMPAFVDGSYMRVDKRGTLWWRAHYRRIGFITRSGRTWSKALPGIVSDEVGPDGNLWFIAKRNIGRISSRGEVATFSLPEGVNQAWKLIPGPSQDLWFGTPRGPGRVTTDGSVTVFPVSSEPFPGVSTPGGAAFYVDGGRVLRVDENGRVSTVGRAKGGAIAPVVASDGAVWFTPEFPRTRLVNRIGASGVIRQFRLPAGYGGWERSTSWLLPGPNGAVWAVGQGEMMLVSTAGRVDRYALGRAKSLSPIQAMCARTRTSIWILTRDPARSINLESRYVLLSISS